MDTQVEAEAEEDESVQEIGNEERNNVQVYTRSERKTRYMVRSYCFGSSERGRKK